MDGNGGSGVSGVGNGGSGVSGVGNGGSGVGNSGGGYSLDGVGSGLSDKRLVNGLVSTEGSGDWDLSVDRNLLEDGLGNMGGPDNRGRLVGGNGGGDVSVGGLSNGVGQGGDLGGDAGEGMSLGGGVSEVASKTVMLNGSGIMSRCSHQVRSSS